MVPWTTMSSTPIFGIRICASAPPSCTSRTLCGTVVTPGLVVDVVEAAPVVDDVDVLTTVGLSCRSCANSWRSLCCARAVKMPVPHS